MITIYPPEDNTVIFFRNEGRQQILFLRQDRRYCEPLKSDLELLSSFDPICKLPSF
jgi:hypothetical protein